MEPPWRGKHHRHLPDLVTTANHQEGENNMGRRVIEVAPIIKLTDDLDYAKLTDAQKAKADAGEATAADVPESEAHEDLTLEFDGRKVAITLRDKNYAALKGFLDTYLDAGQPVTPPKPEIPYNKDWAKEESYEMQAAHLVVKTWAVSANFANGSWNIPEKNDRPTTIAGPCSLKVLGLWFQEHPDHPVNELLKTWSIRGKENQGQTAISAA